MVRWSKDRAAQGADDAALDGHCGGLAVAATATSRACARHGRSTTVLIALLVTTIGRCSPASPRHRPAGAAKHAGDVRPRGRGRRRHRRAAARQDRHDHARQPPGVRVHSRRGRRPARPRPRPLSSCWPTEEPGSVLAKEYGIRGHELSPLQFIRPRRARGRARPKGHRTPSRSSSRSATPGIRERFDELAPDGATGHDDR